MTITPGDPKATHDEARTGAGSPRRWWLAVGVGCAASLPLSWLLSFGSALPFFLGLFFFALFGVVIGAVVFRVAAPRRPYHPASVVMGTAIVVAVGWAASMLKEAWDFPSDMAVQAAKGTRSIGDQTVQEYRAAVANDVRRLLREKYPPGDAVGYVRWVVADGKLAKGDIAQVNQTLRPPQRGYVWLTRVVLSIILLAFGVGSQTLPLRRASGMSPRSATADDGGISS